jgi:hypothetical protein
MKLSGSISKSRLDATSDNRESRLRKPAHKSNNPVSFGVYDARGNVIETHEHKGDFKEWSVHFFIAGASVRWQDCLDYLVRRHAEHLFLVQGANESE